MASTNDCDARNYELANSEIRGRGFIGSSILQKTLVRKISVVQRRRRKKDKVGKHSL